MVSNGIRTYDRTNNRYHFFETDTDIFEIFFHRKSETDFNLLTI